MNDIPVTFTYQGKEYKGILTEVPGAGGTRGTVWHLTVDKTYWGQLIFLETGFVFHSQNNHEEMKYLGEVFGLQVMLWHE